jgi:hypothetical protein
LLDAGAVNSADEVLMVERILEASLLGNLWPFILMCIALIFGFLENQILSWSASK